MGESTSRAARPTNRLAEETSPYLLQHQHNPVDWYSWGAEAFEKARSEDKPIFLSVGYSSCHWCHVMEDESFEDEEIAGVLNEHFVSVKVDREERPDVDGLYMDFVHRATGQGGWPLSVFLFPDGRPFYGGTYFPPEDRFGRPGFKRILERMAEYWKEERGRLEASAEEVAEGLQVDVMEQIQPGELTEDLLESAVTTLAQQFDVEHGGFGEAPKFPQAATLSFLLREAAATGNHNARRMALHTLERMARGGIYDHLGGGFHRYSTDARWLVPHFEKMLYDNAMLGRAYLEAFQLTGDDQYRKVAEETLDYVRREMTSDDGGFYTAQDADTEGEEGKYYVWDESEVRARLSEDEFRVAAAYFDVSSDGNWEGRSILHTPFDIEIVAGEFDMDVDAARHLVEQAREKLFAARQERIAPGVDDKVLTAWNAMMCTTFVAAYNVTREDEYLQTAQRNADFVLDRLYREKEDRLLRTYRDDRAQYDAYIEDYAYLTEALTALYEATGDERRLSQATSMAESMVAKFWDEERGGFYFSNADTGLLARRKDILDNAMPAGNSVAVHVLLRLAVLHDRSDFRVRAEQVLERLADPMLSQPGAFGYLLQAARTAIGPRKEIVLVGPDREPFLAELFRHLLPALWVVQADEEESSSLTLLEGREMRDGETTAYVCEDYSCQQPVTDIEAFREQLG